MNFTFFTVFSTYVTLSSSPPGSVSENVDITLTCTTDEANPSAEVVWSRDGVEVIPAFGDVTTESGLYNTQRRVSKLSVRTNKTLNGAVYNCTVAGTDLSRDYLVDITCKYSLTCTCDHSHRTNPSIVATIFIPTKHFSIEIDLTQRPLAVRDQRPLKS